MKIEEQLQELLVKHDIQGRLDLELQAELEDLISTIRREAIEGFIDECLEDSALLDEEIGVETAMVKQKRWVNLDKLRDLASDYLQEKNNE